MSNFVQSQMAQTMRSKAVFYNAVSGTAANYDLKIGYPVCYDTVVGVAVTTFDDFVRGRCVAKPATANLFGFAGIVKALGPRFAPSSTTDYSRWCDILCPQRGDYFWCLGYCAASASDFIKETTLCKLVDAKWHCIVGGVGNNIIGIYAGEDSGEILEASNTEILLRAV